MRTDRDSTRESASDDAGNPTRNSAFTSAFTSARDCERIRALCESALSRPPNAIENVAAGMGARRFYRLDFEGNDPATMIARVEDTMPDPGSHTNSPDEVAPSRPIAKTPAPSWLPEPSLEPIRSFLESGGLPVPKSFARDAEYGIELLEDVGTRTLMAARGPAQIRLYSRACHFVPKLQSLEASPGEVPAFGRIYDRALLESKIWKFEHWTIPGLLGREANAEERAALAELVEKLNSEFENAPRRLAHRDYKAENLHWTAGPQSQSASSNILEPTDTMIAGAADADGRLVLIDVQGAFMAPPEYDLVCLLYDLQVDLAEAQVEALFEQVRPLLPDAPNRAEAARRFDLLAVARLCKDVSHVVEAGLVRGDRRRWNEIPRGLALISLAAGRQEHTFPCLRALTSVIPALTAAARSSDSAKAEPGRLEEQK